MARQARKLWKLRKSALSGARVALFSACFYPNLPQQALVIRAAARWIDARTQGWGLKFLRFESLEQLGRARLLHAVPPQAFKALASAFKLSPCSWLQVCDLVLGVWASDFSRFSDFRIFGFWGPRTWRAMRCTCWAAE